MVCRATSHDPFDYAILSARALFGKAARVMAALRHSRAICASCSHQRWRVVVDIFCPFRPLCLMRVASFVRQLGAVDHRLSKPKVNQTPPWQRGCLSSVTARSCCFGTCSANIQSRSSGGENISWPGCCFCESLRFRCDTLVCELQAPKQCVHASVVASCDFRRLPAASPGMFHTNDICLLLCGSDCPASF